MIGALRGSQRDAPDGACRGRCIAGGVRWNSLASAAARPAVQSARRAVVAVAPGRPISTRLGDAHCLCCCSHTTRARRTEHRCCRQFPSALNGYHTLHSHPANTHARTSFLYLYVRVVYSIINCLYGGAPSRCDRPPPGRPCLSARRATNIRRAEGEKNRVHKESINFTRCVQGRTTKQTNNQRCRSDSPVDSARCSEFLQYSQHPLLSKRSPPVYKTARLYCCTYLQYVFYDRR